MKTKTYKKFTAALGFTLLAACGGGSGDNNNNPAVDNVKPYALSPLEKEQFEAAKTGTELLSQRENRNIILGNHIVHSHLAEGGKTRRRYDARPFSQGLHEYSVDIVYPDNNSRDKGRLLSYQGFRGGIFKVYSGHDDIAGYVYGYDTPVKQWPNSGKATYQGIAFDQHGKGTLTYHIDFARKNGHGTVEGISKYGNITLHPAIYETEYDEVANRDIYINKGDATAANGKQMEYRTFLFGAQAEEIGGYVDTDDDSSMAIYGTRGNIQ